MDIEKELLEKEAEIAARKITPPNMANVPVGPTASVGPKGPVGPRAVRPPVETPKVETVKRSRVAQLDAYTILRVELLSTKKKLAETDERMGLLAVQDARQRRQELDKEEAALMLEVSRKLGAAEGSTIRLVDKERGLCQVE